MHIAAGSEHSALVTGKLQKLYLYYAIFLSNNAFDINTMAEDGVIMTWGWGEHGQLGLGNTCDRMRPEVVSLSRDVRKEAAKIKVYCGSGFTIVLRSLLKSDQPSEC